MNERQRKQWQMVTPTDLVEAKTPGAHGQSNGGYDRKMGVATILRW